MTRADRDARYGWFFQVMRETALPEHAALAGRVPARAHRGDVHGDRGTDTRRPRSQPRLQDQRLFVPRGSWDAKVLDDIAPIDDEIVLPKTSSSVFISTNFDYVLRNLGVRSLIIAGVLTDQCVEFGGARCLRSRLSGDGTDGRLRHADRRTP